MPRRDDIQTILIIGSGPIVIGQAAEFDYSGTQALRALQGAGYRLVVVNSNSATIMTDPHLADAVYVEPLTVEVLTRIIERERPDAVLPTMGGQTALNLTVSLDRSGVLRHYGVEVLGASLKAIERAEDREQFKETVMGIGLEVPRSAQVNSVSAALAVAATFSYPVIVRPSYTLGGTGGGIAQDARELEGVAASGIAESPAGSILVEESVIGWKEYELEVMRDCADNAVVICSIENLDPMGIHTGDSVTVAPAQTLTDKEYQRMRDAGIAVLRAVGVETGGANVQFAIEPNTGRMLLIEMNPRVSRSSALASKATGYPIAKVAALLAVGYRLDEIRNDITRQTTAAFEPTLDYVVVKIPRLQPEKFSATSGLLGLQMKSVGEVMAIGRTFKEALGKALRSLELDGTPQLELSRLREHLAHPTADRLAYLFAGFRQGLSVEEVYSLTAIDRWFLEELREFIKLETVLRRSSFEELDAPCLRCCKAWGFSDRELAEIFGRPEQVVRNTRVALGVRPIYKMVDSCAAEFAATTPYYYSTYADGECEAARPAKECVVVLGSGPNRIGQGIEFDYANVHATWAIREAGYDVVMVNSNPETVSTDYDISDRLYFEPVTAEDVLEIVAKENPIGVLVGFGGQTPLKLAQELVDSGITLLGTSLETIELTENRHRFGELLARLGIGSPPWEIARSPEEAIDAVSRVGFPVLVRPSYVLGGRAMAIVRSLKELLSFIGDAERVSPGRPVFLDRYIEGAWELDVDVLTDGDEVWIAGLMEQIEEAGVHSGDSASVLPPVRLPQQTILNIEKVVTRLSKEIGAIGLLNIQMAVKDETLYVLEANPRASRTVPFVSKAVGIPIAKIAARVLIGESLREALAPYQPFPTRLGAFVSGDEEGPCFPTPWPRRVFVKESVFPFRRYPGSDVVLGPEMRSTGEVMAIGEEFAETFAKAQIAAGNPLPTTGTILVSFSSQDRKEGLELIARLHSRGFHVLATEGTARDLTRIGVPCKEVRKVGKGHPDVVDVISEGDIDLVINTPSPSQDDGARPHPPHATEVRDLSSSPTAGRRIRRCCLERHIPYVTTLAALRATVDAIQRLQAGPLSLQGLEDILEEGFAGSREDGM